MNTLSFIIAYFIYGAIEIAFRVGVLTYFTSARSASWKLLTPSVYMLLSPGYWISANCKKYGPPTCRPKELRSQLIRNFNLWNMVISGLFLLVVLSVRSEGYRLVDTAISVVAWRFISRSFEIAIAFANDITTPARRSTLDNSDRMKLALRSYVEIFVYSTAFYACAGGPFQGFSQPLLDALYVGTFTDVPTVAKKLDAGPLWVFLQVFATLSLVVLSIAGYLGKVKGTET